MFKFIKQNLIQILFFMGMLFYSIAIIITTIYNIPTVNNFAANVIFLGTLLPILTASTLFSLKVQNTNPKLSLAIRCIVTLVVISFMLTLLVPTIESFFRR
jgi:hypothetical protein